MKRKNSNVFSYDKVRKTHMVDIRKPILGTITFNSRKEANSNKLARWLFVELGATMVCFEENIIRFTCPHKSISAGQKLSLNLKLLETYDTQNSRVIHTTIAPRSIHFANTSNYDI
jgi:hypothetical protein